MFEMDALNPSYLTPIGRSRSSRGSKKHVWALKQVGSKNLSATYVHSNTVLVTVRSSDGYLYSSILYD